VALATDFTLIHTTAPRFSKDKDHPGCAAYLNALIPGDELKKHYAGEQYNIAQSDGVVYADAMHPKNLAPYVMDKRTYNFNTDGLAHYGLLPDLLEDMKNVKLPASAFDALFGSAEAYIRTWEKAERIAGVTDDPNFKPMLPDCETKCRGLCPESPNAGAPQGR
jgi:hypothetical protein